MILKSIQNDNQDARLDDLVKNERDGKMFDKFMAFERLVNSPSAYDFVDNDDIE